MKSIVQRIILQRSGLIPAGALPLRLRLAMGRRNLI